MINISFEIPGPPVGKQRPVFYKGHAFTPKKTRHYERVVGYAAKSALIPYDRELYFRKNLTVEITGIYPIPTSISKVKRQLYLEQKIVPSKPDIDNVTKAVLDGLNKVAYYDDVQVHLVTARKLYGANPCVIVNLSYKD